MINPTNHQELNEAKRKAPAQEAVGRTLVMDETAVDVIKKDIKNMNLTVLAPDGRVRLSVPRRMKEAAIHQFVASKLPWIRKQQEKMKHRPRAAVLQYVTGEIHPVAGEGYALTLIETGTGRQRVELKENRQLEMYLRPGKDRAAREQVMNQFYRELLKEQIPRLIAKWEPVMGVQVADWGVKRMKTRWGTCNVKAGRIWLNLALAKGHPRCLEYIVIHEMNHLLERKHSPRFHELMDGWLPDWRQWKKGLMQV